MFKTLILTGFLFMSALAFGDEPYYQQCLTNENSGEIQSLAETYHGLKGEITSQQIQEDTFLVQMEVLENEHRGLIDRSYPIPPGHVWDRYRSLFEEIRAVRNSLFLLEWEVNDTRDRLSNLCHSFIVD